MLWGPVLYIHIDPSYDGPVYSHLERGKKPGVILVRCYFKRQREREREILVSKLICGARADRAPSFSPWVCTVLILLTLALSVLCLSDLITFASLPSSQGS